MEFVKVLRQRAIQQLWYGQVISAIGDRLFEVAVVWLAVEEVGERAGLIVVAGTLASLGFGVFGGVFADRWNRRTTMVISDLLRAGVLFSLVAIAVFAELQLWQLAVATTLLGALNALFEPALYASLPALSPDRRSLQAANGLIDMTWRISNTTGPAIAGVLLATTPVSLLFFADGLTFILSALAIYTIGRGYAWRPAREIEDQQSPVADLRDGVRVLSEHKVLLWSYIITSTQGNVMWALTFMVGIPLYVSDVLELDASAFGWIITSYGVGNVLSSFVLGNRSVRRHVVVMYAGTVLLSAGFLVMVIGGTFTAALIGAFLASLGGPLEDVMQLLIIQNELPPTVIGKVYSLRTVFEDVGFAAGLGLAALLYNALSVSDGIALVVLIQMSAGLYGIVRFGLRAQPLALDSKPVAN